MMSSTAVSAGPKQQLFIWRYWAIVLVLTITTSGCASPSPSINAQTVNNLPPLHLDGRTISVADAARAITRPDLLSLDAPMQEFVERYTGGQNNSRVRLMSLHQMVGGVGGLNMQYDPFADGTARDAFHNGTANCLSYASLFVALAREAGLDASYQWLEVRPQWRKVSERVQVGLHVNVAVKLRDGRRYIVDIDPLPSTDVTGTQTLTDSDAEALYFNNIAMDALGNQEVEQAWSNLVQALRLSPKMSHLWVNLGAVYRFGGQHRDAETSYMRALQLDPGEYSAMTNLALLYGIEGREDEKQYWLERVERHRLSNPYYHAWQGDDAAVEGNWTAALQHYDRAVHLLPQDSSLLFSRGLIYFQLNDFDAASADISQAIELATRRSDITLYQLQLEEVRRAQVAGV